MTLAEAVLAVLLRLPGPYEAPGHEEPPAERHARLQTIATAIGVVAEETTPGWRWGPRKKAAALVASSYDEGQRFHRAVHSGERRGDCKAGNTRCRAACLNQVHQQLTISRAEWTASMGTDLVSTTMCMRLGARVLAASGRCVAGNQELDAYQASRLFTMYATGYRCRPITLATQRGWHWQRIDRRLEELLLRPRSALAGIDLTFRSGSLGYVS